MNLEYSGKKTHIYFFGTEIIEKEKFFILYDEITNLMKKDGFDPSHLGLFSKFTPGAYYRTRKRTEKRYLNIIKEDFENAYDFSWSCVVPEWAKEAPACFSYLECAIFLHEYNDSGEMLKNNTLTKTIKGKISFDASIINQVNIVNYCDIYRKYLPWDEEIVFESVKGFWGINISHLITHGKFDSLAKLEHEQKIKILSHRFND